MQRSALDLALRIVRTKTRTHGSERRGRYAVRHLCDERAKSAALSILRCVAALSARGWVRTKLTSFLKHAESSVYGPSRRKPSFGFQAGPDVREFRTDTNDPKQPWAFVSRLTLRCRHRPLPHYLAPSAANQSIKVVRDDVWGSTIGQGARKRQEDDQSDDRDDNHHNDHFGSLKL